MLVDDGANFPGPRVRGENRPLVTDFHRKAHSDRPMPTVRHANARTYVVTNPLVALMRTHAREDIKSRLKPISPALSNLHRFVQLMLVGKDPVDRRLKTFKRVIAMKLNHRSPWSDCVRSVDLNLVVALRMERQRSYGSQEGELNAFH